MGDYAILWRAGSVCPVIVIQGYRLRFMSPPFQHRSPCEILCGPDQPLFAPPCRSVSDFGHLVSYRLQVSYQLSGAQGSVLGSASLGSTVPLPTCLVVDRFLWLYSPVDTTLSSHSTSGAIEHWRWMPYHNLVWDCGSTCFVNFPC